MQTYFVVIGIEKLCTFTRSGLIIADVHSKDDLDHDRRSS